MGLKNLRKDQLLSVGLAVLCASVITIGVFLNFPIMGHDFYLFFSWMNDYHFAWDKFGVFNIMFSPQRCLGVPVMANPLSANYSLFHLIALFFNDVSSAIIIINLYTVASFWGCLRFLSLFELSSSWKNYIAAAWCLQGFIFFHVVVGHVGFIAAGLWPLYAWLLAGLKGKKGEITGVLLCGLFLAHDFHSALTYLFVMFPLAFFLMIGILHLYKQDFNWKRPLVKIGLSYLLTLPLIIQKVMQTIEFTSRYQRDVSFHPIEMARALQYSFMSQFFPLPLDYQAMTGWWYGDWESTIFIFPGLLLVVLVLSAMRFQTHKKTLFSLSFLFIVGTFISSGLYDLTIRSLPVIKSFHVNPRWMFVLSLSTLVVMGAFLEKEKIKPIIILPFLALNIAACLWFVDRQTLNINYSYHEGYNAEKNILTGCYEPVFGYRLELFPFNKGIPGKWMDPRCYLTDKCKSFVLPEDKVDDLLKYKLQPFSE